MATEDLYASYLRYCEDHGDIHPWSKTLLARELSNLLPQVRHVGSSDGPRGFDFSIKPPEHLRAVLSTLADGRPFAEAMTVAEAVAELDRVLVLGRECLSMSYDLVSKLEKAVLTGQRKLKDFKQR